MMLTDRQKKRLQQAAEEFDYIEKAAGSKIGSVACALLVLAARVESLEQTLEQATDPDRGK